LQPVLRTTNYQVSRSNRKVPLSDVVSIEMYSRIALNICYYHGAVDYKY